MTSSPGPVFTKDPTLRIGSGRLISDLWTTERNDPSRDPEEGRIFWENQSWILHGAHVWKSSLWSSFMNWSCRVKNEVINALWWRTVYTPTRSSLSLFLLLLIKRRCPDSKFVGPTWGPPGSCRPQMGTMLAPRTLLSGGLICIRKRHMTTPPTTHLNHASHANDPRLACQHHYQNY